MKHYIFTLLLILLPAWANAVVRVNGMYYDLDQANGTATVTNVFDEDGDPFYTYYGDVVIPNTVIYKGITYIVTSIGNNTFKNNGITSITIPSSITSIGAEAFMWTNLSTITIPKSVTSIGANAFAGTSLYDYHTNGVVYVDKWACGYNGTMPSGTTITLKDGTIGIAGEAFSGGTGLTSIIIPNSVTSIGYKAFSGCSSLSDITIPNSVTTIGQYAFDGTRWYNNQPSGMIYAGRVAYEYKGSSSSVTLNEGTISITDGALSNKRSLTNVVIPNSVISIGDRAFSGCTSLQSITIPNSVISIGSEAFSGCTSLQSITIPNSVTHIGFGALQSPFATIVVNASNKKFDSRRNCNAIVNTSTNSLIIGCKNTVIPNTVTSIGDWAFRGCSGLTNITIPNSVTSIGAYAFENCSGLTNIIIPNSVTNIGDGAFYGCMRLKSIEIPQYVTSIGNQTFQLCIGLTSVVIPQFVKTIGNEAFSNCYGLTSISIPNSVTSIGDYAFYYCSNLTSVNIPNSVKSIGDDAFSCCSKLISVTSEIETPKTLWLNPFYGISNNCILTVPIGTRDAYISAGWTEDIFKGGVVENDTTLQNTYEVALAAITDGNYYQIFTEVEGTKFYLTNTGTLTADADAAYSFHFSAVNYSGTLYETGWNVGVPFTNPSLTSGSSGDIVNGGNIRTDSQNRNDWERQVFFFKYGKYAVRSTNANSSSWGANTYWDMVGTTSLPEAGYSLAPSYIWQLDDVTGKVLLANARTIVAAKDGVGDGLFLIPEDALITLADAVDAAAAVIESGTATSAAKAQAIDDLRDALDTYRNSVVQPDPGTFYTFQQKASGLFMGLTASGITIVAEENASPLSFIPGDNGGYYLKTDDDLYVGFAGSNNWTMSTSADKKYEWLITSAGDNYYRITKPGNANHHVGTNDGATSEGSPCYANKNNSDNSYYLWKIAEVEGVVKPKLGDTNGDGKVTITDAVAIVNYILGNPPANFVYEAADVNNDNKVTITDAVAIINMILAGQNEANIREAEILPRIADTLEPE